MAGVVGLINSRPSSLNLWRISSYRRFWEKYRNTWVLERASVSKKSQWAFLSAAAKNKINTHITPEQRETNAWSGPIIEIPNNNMIWYNHMITWLYNKIERDSDKTLQTPAKYIRLTQHSHHILFQGPAPRYWLFPPYMSKCLYVWVFICLYVHTFWKGCKYWILDKT